MYKSLVFISFTFFILFILFIVSCQDSGTTDMVLFGNEYGLPTELKGLKVYTVAIKDGNLIRVAVLNNEINSIGYKNGEINNTTLMINNNSERNFIEVKQILIENDTLIVCRK